MILFLEFDSVYYIHFMSSIVNGEMTDEIRVKPIFFAVWCVLELFYVAHIISSSFRNSSQILRRLFSFLFSGTANNPDSIYRY